MICLTCYLFNYTEFETTEGFWLNVISSVANLVNTYLDLCEYTNLEAYTKEKIDENID